MDKIIEQLINFYQFDLDVLTNPYTWYPLGILGIAYCLFMILKWGILLCPIRMCFVSLSYIFRGTLAGHSPLKKSKDLW